MRKLLLIALLTTCLISCKKDQTVSEPTIQSKIVGRWKEQSNNIKVYSSDGTLLIDDQEDFGKDNSGRLFEYTSDGNEIVHSFLHPGDVTNYTYKIRGNILTDWEGDNEQTNQSPLDFEISKLTDTDLTLVVTLIMKPFNDYVDNPKLDPNTQYKFVFTNKLKREK